MDLLAKERMLRALGIILYWLVCFSANGNCASSRYGLSGVYYFEDPGSLQVNSDELRTDELWSELDMTSYGRGEVYIPPKQVIDLLQSPSLDSVRQYINWNELRIDRIIKAQQLLEELTLSEQ